jgi:uncharacterized membrane protein (UPF0127 family)
MDVYVGSMRVALDAKKVAGLAKIFGLMFRTKNTRNLLFEFKKKMKVPITSLFVFFSFMVLWLDEENNILDIDIVRPFRLSVSPNVEYEKFIEIPINDSNQELVDFFVDKIRKV